MQIEIKSTADGSDTLYNSRFDEHYHSVNGAVQESKHVFIEAGLKRIPKEKISVLEIGFGTGLNAFLTLLYARDLRKRIGYTGMELYPVSDEILEKLNYSQTVSPVDSDLFRLLHTAEWGSYIEIIPSFSLQKIRADITGENITETGTLFDLIYFDAFAPDKQPEMWTQKIFDYLFLHTSDNGVMVTYCAKGSVRRMMQQAGYEVERLPGPPGKREMLRAVKTVNT